MLMVAGEHKTIMKPRRTFFIADAPWAPVDIEPISVLCRELLAHELENRTTVFIRASSMSGFVHFVDSDGRISWI